MSNGQKQKGGPRDSHTKVSDKLAVAFVMSVTDVFGSHIPEAEPNATVSAALLRVSFGLPVCASWLGCHGLTMDDFRV